MVEQLKTWCVRETTPDVLHVVFEGSACDEGLGWDQVDRWTRTRAVTVAEVRSDIRGAVLDVALCSDLVYLRHGVALLLDHGEPSPGLVWALGRAGRAALSRGLLDTDAISAGEAVRLGMAQRVLEREEPVPLPEGASLVAMTAARDLMRCSVDARPALELASFRFLFASGDPIEGADAFLERRDPEFDDHYN